jgi:uncharacterized protein YrzB (UPF0473 family)
MNQQKDIIRDARVLGTPKMLLLGLQHMFAMFGATILVPILVNSYFQSTSQVLSVQVTLFCAGFGTLFFHLCTKFKVPAFLGSSFAFLGGFSSVAALDTGIFANMADKEKATPVTPDEIDDIRVTLDLDEGEVECKILTIFDVNEQDYIALMPLNPDGSDPDEGTVYLYRYAEDEDGIPQIDSITDDDEYEAAADRFDEMLDDDYFNALEDEE